MSTLRTTSAGIAIIKEFEGFRGQAYLCPAGVWTIGYGHTSAAGAPAVVKGQMINRQRAEDILRSDVDRFENAIEG
ncbi:MAG: lysozyme, partial [Rhizobiales bacterium 32-66-8]